MDYRLCVFGVSHCGLVRANNEDAWLALEEIGFFAVADGMGGHRAGEVASHEAVTTAGEAMQQVAGKAAISALAACNALRGAIEKANSRVFELGRSQPHWKGMGTTLCCICFFNGKVVYGHVGDSRIYRMRAGLLEQLTRDDSLLMELIDQGMIAEGGGVDFAQRHVITKAIGMAAAVEPAVYSAEVERGDVYLLCSDGLSDYLDRTAIQHRLSGHPPQIAAEKLLDEALCRGGRDNITAVVIEVQGNG